MKLLGPGKSCSNSSDGASAGRRSPILGEATSTTTNNAPAEEQEQRRRRRRREEEERRRWREQEATLETERILFQLKEIKSRLEENHLRALHEALRPATTAGDDASNLLY